ncbi:hypothetical protein VTN96DRAFT_2992 [Rasamsonia emersonii]|uniref:HCNGP-like protein n=1 Tax=Rasamsonia emersonii (strain ATCC 16479 / CBS 393.64 / IMI 116815) TaxID=1408163 RepID=A0A0F4YRE7_RASE3|nr:Uncharacterized protein T310_5332 [Rasamsonia emersonii CBS 393.64]KKA20655.1 Uncharacterized protein T310_5332 [Rasamsonia emersonii CBS 393.64]
MLGLGAYESSSEDEAKGRVSSPTFKSDSDKQQRDTKRDINLQGPSDVKNEPQPEATVVDPGRPVLGPHQPQDTSTLSDNHLASGQSSPYSATRALIHDLTLPPVPDLDIPPSPPGSPDPAANTKFSHFLSLKKQGVHFNEKLAGSSSLKNPSLLVKLRQHAGIDDAEQYATSLPLDIWDVSSLPDWGYKEELVKTQQATRLRLEEKARASGQRDSIEFVPSSTTRDGRSSSERRFKTTSTAG